MFKKVLLMVMGVYMVSAEYGAGNYVLQEELQAAETAGQQKESMKDKAENEAQKLKNKIKHDL